MRKARIDKLHSFTGLALNLICIALYFGYAELVLEFTVLNGINNEIDHYVSMIFSEEEQKYAMQFKEDLNSLGERAVIVPGTTVYRYKPAKTKSFTINSFGFRGEELSPKQKDEYRIVFFGNSKVLGYLIPDKDTIPYVVQEKLRNHFKDKPAKITVFNFGTEAFNLQRSIETAKLYHADLEADFVVFYSVAIDINESYLWGAAGLKPFAEGDKVPEIFLGRNESGNFRSNLFHIVKSSFFGDIYKFEINSAKHDLMSYPIPPLQLQFMHDFPPAYTASIKEITDYFKKLEIPSLIILPPIVQTKNPPSEHEKNLMFQRELYASGVNQFTKKSYLEIIKEVKALPDINVLDHSGVFNGMEETVFFDGVHLTPTATKMSADKIADEIINILESEHYLDKK